MRIIIDSVDKRMTIPAIDYLVGAGLEVHGICFNTDKPLNVDRLKKVHYINKKTAEHDLSDVFSRYTPEDIIIAGNPVIIEAVNVIKPNTKYLLSSQENIDRAISKDQLQLLADALSIRIPNALKSPCFPMIVKLNVSENVQLKPAERYRIIRNEGQLIEAETFIKRHADNLIMQEYVEGPSMGVSMLLDEQSRLVDFIVHERLLEYPISGGPSAACRSVVNTELAAAAYLLLRKLDWKGIAMVEFKGDRLIEINPRFWGSMPLLFVCKSDFFGNYIKILQNKHTVITPEQTLYRPKKTMVYFPQGFISVLHLLKAKKLKMAAFGFITLLRGKEGIFRIRNPKPFLRYIKALISRNSGVN